MEKNISKSNKAQALTTSKLSCINIIKIENFVKTMDFLRSECALSGLLMYNERYETENLKIIILKEENINLKN